MYAHAGSALRSRPVAARQALGGGRAESSAAWVQCIEVKKLSAGLCGPRSGPAPATGLSPAAYEGGGRLCAQARGRDDRVGLAVRRRRVVARGWTCDDSRHEITTAPCNALGGIGLRRLRWQYDNDGACSILIDAD